jgi:hypothetical protein
VIGIGSTIQDEAKGWKNLTSKRPDRNQSPAAQETNVTAAARVQGVGQRKRREDEDSDNKGEGTGVDGANIEGKLYEVIKELGGKECSWCSLAAIGLTIGNWHGRRRPKHSVQEKGLREWSMHRREGSVIEMGLVSSVLVRVQG